MSDHKQVEDKSLLLILFEDIKTVVDALESIKGKTVIYAAQEDNEAQQRPFLYPYVAVQMNIDWEMPEAIGSGGNYKVSNVGSIAGEIGLQRKGLATITIHVRFKNRENDTEVFLQNEAIKHEVHRAVDLLEKDPYYTELLKLAENTPVNDGKQQDHTITYICSVKEGALIKGTEGIISSFGVNDLNIPTE